jgi:hypothetical protein
MHDYDELTTILPMAVGKTHLVLTDSALCVLKLAAKSEDILSANNKILLGSFGHDLPLSTDNYDKPTRILSPEQRREITNELIRNRTAMYDVLNNRPR